MRSPGCTRRKGEALPWLTCMKPPVRPISTCSADATANQFLLMASSLRCRRREHAQAMAVGIEGDEGVAEIHRRRRLGDRQAALLPVGVRALDRGGIVDGEGDLAAAAGRCGSR